MPPPSPVLTSAARKASTSLWKVSKRRLRACLGDREQSSAPARWAPSTGGAGPAASPLPADGLLDGSLLQVDVVVEGGGALVIVRLEMERSCAVARPRTGAPAAGR